MDKNEAMTIALNAQTKAQVLAKLIGKDAEVDRLVAKHPNANAKILESLAYTEYEDGGYDDAVRVAVVAHPNVSSSTFRELANLYQDAAAFNPSLMQLVEAEPSLLEDCRRVLESTNCPRWWIENVFSSVTYSLMLLALQNPTLDEEFCKKLDPKKLDEEAADSLNRFELDQEDATSKKIVSSYRELAKLRRYAVPRYLEFDPSQHAHRLADQVICGFPFTSEKWPWPQDSSDGYMQPIAQIDLAQAGQTLGELLGTGLLQVWFPTNEDMLPEWRIVPAGDLTEELDDFYPEDAPWNPNRTRGRDDCLWSISVDVVPSARVQWLPQGSMYPRLQRVLEGQFSDKPEITDSILEDIEMGLLNLNLPSREGEFLPTKYRHVYLGGYVSGHGNESDLISWTDNSRRLLLCVREESGMFTLAVTYSRDDCGTIDIRADISCDR